MPPQPTQETKQCKICGETKPASEFFRRSRSDSRLRGRCKVCHNARRSPESRWHNVAVNLRKRGARPSVPALRTALGEPSTCHICGGSLTWETAEVDHVVPVAQGGSHEPTNLAWAHSDCNRLKGRFAMDQLLDLVKRVATHHALLLAVLLAVLIVPSSAHAYVLGAADGAAEAAPFAQQLGARTYRLVMDSTVPLDAYAPRIEAYRAAGMHPQIVVDGTGTSVRGRSGKNWQTINYAVHAFERWPDAYSVSVFNEPGLAGIGVCQYARTFNRAYKMLKRAGVPRVLFGEFEPDGVYRWTAAMHRCVRSVTADGFAWHGYDWHPKWVGITQVGGISRMLEGFRPWLHTRQGRALPIYCTEYGVPTPGRYSYANQNGAQMWARAFAYVRKYHVKQIVAWGILEVGGASDWDTSTVAADGTPRPAFFTIASASR